MITLQLTYNLRSGKSTCGIPIKVTNGKEGSNPGFIDILSAKILLDPITNPTAPADVPMDVFGSGLI